MLFTSWEFARFLPLVLGIYYCLSRRAQLVLLIAAGYFFYGWWDWRFCGLLAFSTILDYTLGRAMGATKDPRRRKSLLVLSIVANLGFLGFFKYFNFFVGSFTVMAHKLGFEPNVTLLHVVLPVGISFYTFQSMAYVIDVYRRVFPAEHDFIAYTAYVSYFPQLVAGPIERAPHLLTQLKRPRVVDGDLIYSGAMLMLIGFFKKMAIADAVALSVEQAFIHSADGSWVLLLKGIWLFAIQIYCDFSGYTDIARGVSRLFGVELMENFNQPYLSTNITEFWRRWHISLSTWLRDYLYISLGGNRKGELKTYRNLMITMILGGLWHGASWTFVIWGTLHGIYLAAHKFLHRKDVKTTRAPVTPGAVHPDSSVAQVPKTSGFTEPGVTGAPWKSPYAFLCMIGTFHLVLLTWIFFRAPSLRAALDYLEGIVTFRGGAEDFGPAMATVWFYMGLMLMIDVPQYLRKDHLAMFRWWWPVRGIVMAGMIVLIVILALNNETPFIYFQF